MFFAGPGIRPPSAPGSISSLLTFPFKDSRSGGRAGSREADPDGPEPQACRVLQLRTEGRRAVILEVPDPLPPMGIPRDAPLQQGTDQKLCHAFAKKPAGCSSAQTPR
ncbi:hypothetical protein KIL84_008837 [Mauremys mutica]|uniref:Uncharacterized protein n=1 Tax=Mauremys mutica TaxID=74926 RepID=A0A9D3X7U4_9SAUR|nr:hypothetical protein KIL84_008837 [Mauremys mutica]